MFHMQYSVSVLFLAALSMLRSSEDQASVPQNKFMGDIEELAASYERKLIEVRPVPLFYPLLFGKCHSSFLDVPLFTV